MKKQCHSYGFFKLFFIFYVSFFTGLINAADSITRGTTSTTTLRVCADPNNLPFSNENLQGFENKIISLIADKLDKPVTYTWFPQTFGFVRNTLQLHECDLISGITTTNERVQNTNPYYHSIYTLVYAKENIALPIDFTDQIYQQKKIGIVAGTPAASLMAKYGLLANIQPYQLMVDTRYYSAGKQMIDDIVKGNIDAAIIWGPIAGYLALGAEKELVIVPLIEESKSLQLDFSITMAVRFNDQEWKEQINNVLNQSKAEIYSILKQFNVPLLNNKGEVIEG